MVFRVPADAFVPGGGRPNTIDGNNWQQFLRPDGTPSSPLIVEGANLFLTAEARQKLFDAAKVRIVKDSSANKCGVITSSYEICASMLLNEAEFMAIKPELVEDVLKKLRELAQMEAELLFREFQHYPGALPHFSERVSNAINKAKDALGVYFADLQLDDPLFDELMPLFHEHLPKKLVDAAGDRIKSRIPIQYIRNAFASSLASKIVYREGIHFIESQPVEKLAERAVVYYREERRVQALLKDLEKSALPQEQKELTMELIRRGGVRAALGIY
jgi:glutamate dehydrogenase